MYNTPNRNDTVILELDRPRELRLGHKALKRFSALTGCTMEGMEEAIKDYTKMTSLVYVMLSQEDGSLTPDQVDDLLDPVPIPTILEKCSQAIAAAFGGEEADPPREGNDPPTEPGAGGTASALPPPSESPSATGGT